MHYHGDIKLKVISHRIIYLILIGSARVDGVENFNYFLFGLCVCRLGCKEVAHSLLFVEFHRHRSTSKDPQNASLDLVRV